MAHFAEIDQFNRVKRVVVVSNADTSDASGVEKEHIGRAFCERLFGGNWVQTSYNGNFRKNYAGMGYTWDATRDAFIPPQPYPSWTLVEATCQWQAPVAMPTDGKMYSWDEPTTSWKEMASAAA
jgi:hypothetical protein